MLQLNLRGKRRIEGTVRNDNGLSCPQQLTHGGRRDAAPEGVAECERQIVRVVDVQVFGLGIYENDRAGLTAGGAHDTVDDEGKDAFILVRTFERPDDLRKIAVALLADRMHGFHPPSVVDETEGLP